jgi:alpha-galactosidase
MSAVKPNCNPDRLVLFLLFVLLGSAPARAATLVAQAGDASISHDPRGGTWTIVSGGATLVLGLDSSRDYEIFLASPSSKPWTIGAMPDTSVTINGSSLRFGNRQDGFVFQGTTLETSAQSLRLTATFDHPATGLRLARHFTVASGSPTFEIWTSYSPLGFTRAILSNLSAFQFTVPAGTLHWVTGLEGDNADVHHDGAFTRQEKTLVPGERLLLGAQGRSSEQVVPWFAIDGAPDEFYAALMWSGAWTLTVNRTSAGLLLAMGLQSTTTTVTSGSIEGPHALLGVVTGGIASASAAIGSYVLQGLRHGRAIMPLVTYNSWFAYGTSIAEDSMRSEMAAAASLGVELFVVDAGWYAGAGAAGPFDFDAGLGSWQPDPVRFPNGLRPLTEYAHSLGLKFGVWVEPERVNVSVVGPSGSAASVAEAWLATSGGRYGSDHAAQICFASVAARKWVLDRLTTLLDSVQPDYLKWDSNMWVNCDRPGHGHGSADGNFTHVNGLYSVLTALRDRYPDLLIENVSGGGNRLDVGMLRFTDVAWMDDRTAPSVHVRHNVEGLSALFPPAYLLSFVTNHVGEPLHDAPDLRLYLRSRMVGALGLCFRSADLSASDAGDIAREIGTYKRFRSTLAAAVASLLTAEATVDQGPAWDVLQETSVDGRELLVSAFQSDVGTGRINVRPIGLLAGTTYEVRSIDAGLLGTSTGSDLMANGIDVFASPASAAHVLIVTARP